jgi:REP element-mobilizing transposase RayT
MCLFGKIENGNMELNDFGKILRNEWVKTPKIRQNVKLDEFVVMPNHIHGIISIVDNCRDTARRVSTLERFGKPVCGSVPTIIRAFKSAVTKNINQYRNTPTAYVWQRGFYDHIIRNEKSLNEIREYIRINPLKWEFDRNNPKYFRI